MKAINELISKYSDRLLNEADTRFKAVEYAGIAWLCFFTAFGFKDTTPFFQALALFLFITSLFFLKAVYDHFINSIYHYKNSIAI